jgi:hypothetical protein
MSFLVPIGGPLLALLVSIVTDSTDLPVGKVRRRQAAVKREEASPEMGDDRPGPIV